MNYGKKGVERREQDFNGRSAWKKRAAVLSLKIVLILFLLVMAAAVCGGLYFVKSVIAAAPDIDAIDAAPSGYMSTVLDTDGNVTAELVASGSNRVYVTLDEIPKDLQHAFVAIEDARFYEHHGIDVKGILRAGVKGLTTGNFSEGASTLTQQLLKNNVFDGWTEEGKVERVRRKIQEQYLALELEKKVNKKWIMENYLNTINLGQNTLGVQAASRRYFGKDVSELTLSECAVLAAITQNPSKYNPISNPKQNAQRREKVLNHMLDQGYISQEAYEGALADPVYDRIQEYNMDLQGDPNVTSYFVDALTKQVIEDLQNKAGYTEAEAYKALYSGGLTIYSTQDAAIQKICDEEANKDSNYGSKKEISFSYALTIQREDGQVENFSHQTMLSYYRKKTGNSKYSINFPTKEKAQKAVEEYKKEMLKAGGTVLGETLTFIPQPQISVTVMDQHDGKVKALVGGRGEKAGSQTLNRATGTIHQAGSTFKIVSTYAPALESGNYTLATLVKDEPYTYANGKPVRNASRRYQGDITLRWAITDSVNVVAVKTLTDITPAKGYEYVKKFGFKHVTEDQVVQSMALGACSVTNMELTGAFASIANEGVYTEPMLYTKILDHDGKVLLENEPKTQRAVKETTAFLLTSAMEDVLDSGTGVAANFGGMSLAAKTGTTNDNKESWLAGFSPYYTCAVWGGNDDNTSLDNTRFTKTIWRNIMQQIHVGKKDIGFSVPKGVQKVRVCKASGMLPLPGICPETETEYFVTGTEQEKNCDLHVEATICKESGLLAGEYCPDELKETRVFIKDPERAPDDAKAEDILPEDTCDIHTEDTQGNLLEHLFPNLFQPGKEDSDQGRKQTGDSGKQTD